MSQYDEPTKTAQGASTGHAGQEIPSCGGSLGRVIKTASLVPDVDARTLRFERQKMARRLLPAEAVRRCFWSKIGKYVEGWKSIDRGGLAHFRNVMTCGSVWMCPVCASKISERRKVELESGIAAAQLLNLYPVLVTLTLQHDRADKLTDLLNDLVQAIKKLRGRKSWTRLADRYGIAGTVTTLEITYGLDNGWHPHKHIMLLCRKLEQSDYDEIKNEIGKEYKKILSKIGRGLSLMYGVDVRSGDDKIADYVAKFGRHPLKDGGWTLAAEMTKGSQKKSLRADDHYTPFQLLDFAKDDDHAGRVFQAYALGVKGKKLMTWSRGLRDLLGMGEYIDDHEIAQLNEDRTSLPFAMFDGEAWRRVRQMPLDVLQAMEQLNFASFKDWAAGQGIYIEPDEITNCDGVPLADVLNVK